MAAPSQPPGLRGRGGGSLPTLCGSFWKYRPIPRQPRMGQWESPYLEEGTAGPEDSRRPPTPTRSPVAPWPGCGTKSPSKPGGDGRAGKKRSPCFLSLFLNPTLEGRGSQLEAMLPPADMSGDSFQCHSWAEEGASAASSRWRNAPCRAQDGPHGPPPQPSAVRAQDASPGGPALASPQDCLLEPQGSGRQQRGSPQPNSYLPLSHANSLTA